MLAWLSLLGIPFAASPLVYLVGHVHSRRTPRVAWLTLAVLLVLLCVWLWLLVYAPMTLTQDTVFGMSALRVDGISALMISLVLGLGVLVVAFSISEMRGQVGEEKYYAMLLLLVGMCIGLVCARDLFNLWVWFEGTALSAYLLIAFYRHQSSALSACLKYFVQTISGSILVLFGVSLILLQTGSLTLNQSLPPSLASLVAGALFIMGFGVKFALFPSYTWMADAYASAPTGISALLSGAVTVTGLIALLKSLALLSAESSIWGAWFIVLGCLNMLVGNLLALAQSDIKRILAYSSVSQIGFVVVALGMGLLTHSEAGLSAGLLHLWMHGLSKALAFLVIGAFISVSQLSLSLNDLRAVAWRYPALGVALVAALLSLAGIPPLAGFVSKLQILLAGVGSSSLVIFAVTLFMALNSVLALAYYLPILNAAFALDDASSALWQARSSIPWSMRLPVLILAALMLILGIMPTLLTGLMSPASQTLLQWFGF